MRATVIAPQCITPGCTRDAAYDSEPPAGGYFSTCDRCYSLSGAGLHAHRHSYTAAQCAANGYDPAHAWTTATTLRPVVENDEIAAWECREPLPNDRGRCGYVITRAEADAHLAHQRGSAFLCRTAVNASNGHGTGPQTDGHDPLAAYKAQSAHEALAAYKALSAAWEATHPLDVR